MTRAVDVAIVSLGSTRGLRQADDSLAELLAELGLSCRVVRVKPGLTWRLRRQITIIDLVEGLAARRAARATEGARAVIVSSATTALLLRTPRVPWALRFDSPTTLNRPGLSGAWQRARERRVMPSADLLLPWSEPAARAAEPLLTARRPPMVRLPIPVDVRPRGEARRDEVVAYAGWFHKRGMDLLCAAWNLAAPEDARLVIGGCEPAAGRAWLARRGVPEPPGLEWAGMLDRPEWLARVERARLFVNASRREDYGIAQLEALALGTPVVTTPSAGPYEALATIRRLSPELVADAVSSDALADALHAGLAFRSENFTASAVAAMAPYRRESVLETLRREVLPALGL
jgi:glycosyltransferase involved in cell wall biosynthesis